MNNNSKLLLAVAFAVVFAFAPVGSADFGTKVTQGDDDFLPQFVAYDTAGTDVENGAFELVTYDPDADTTGDEEYYLRLNEDEDGGSNQIQVGDLNLITGELVASGDEALDYSSSDITEGGAFDVVFFEFEDDFYWYLDSDGDGADDIERNDIRLTAITVDGDSYEVGSRVGLNDNDEAVATAADTAPLTIADGDLSWYDADDDEEWSEGDALLLQTNNDPAALALDLGDFAELNDLRLYGEATQTVTPPPPPPPVNQPPPPPPVGEQPPPPPPVGQQPPPPPPGDDGGDDGGEDGPGTPGFELVALVAALGVALVLVRRKA